MKTVEMSASSLQSKFNVDRHQANLMLTYMLAGVSEEEAAEKVVGFSSSSSKKANVNSSLACPRCNSQMRVVELDKGRKAKYCPNDRVTLPMQV